MQNQILLILLVLLPVVCACVSFLAGLRCEKARDIFAVCAAAAELAIVLCAVFGGGELSLEVQGICGLGIGFTMDGFRGIYCTLIAFVWLMTLLFSREYFRSYEKRNRYYFFNLLTMGATMGVFLAADLYTAFIFFEIMSFTSYEWVAHDEEPDALRAADTYLGIAVIGGLVALMGLFLLYNRLGTLTINRLYAASQSVAKSELYLPAACLLFGFGAKAGMFPLHIWLPKAHPIAPAPASAILSGILTKAGVFGILAVACNIFSGDEVWGTVILTLGTVTMVLGAVLALLSINLKRTLACSSVSQIGFILVGIGIMCLLGKEGQIAARGTVLHMVNHSMLKLVLFMSAGAVFMQIHELDLNRIRGFGRGKPFLNVVFLMGALGIVGIPLWNGYVSKTLLHEGIVEYSHVLAETGRSAGAIKTVEWLFLISGGLTAAYMAKLYAAIFIEKNSDCQAEFDAMSGKMSAASYAALGIPAATLPAMGLLPKKIMDGVAASSAGFFAAEGFTDVNYFALENLKGSAISVMIGAAVYFLIVRRLLMVRTENGSVYVDRLPKWLDLEDGVYRPLLKAMTEIFGRACSALNVLLEPLYKAVKAGAAFASRLIKDVPDALVLALADTVFVSDDVAPQDMNRKMPKDRLGRLLDRILGKRSAGSEEDTDRYMRIEESIYVTTKKVKKSLSFSLLVCCVGVLGVMIYLIFIST